MGTGAARHGLPSHLLAPAALPPGHRAPLPQPSSIITLPSNSKVLLGACMLQRGATYKQIAVPAGSEVRRRAAGRPCQPPQPCTACARPPKPLSTTAPPAPRLLKCPQLILADEDMAVDVGSILVSGALRAGGPDCRLTARLTLTFHPQPGVDAFNMASGAGGGGVGDGPA